MSSPVPSILSLEDEITKADEFQKDIIKVSEIQMGMSQPWTIKATVFFKPEIDVFEGEELKMLHVEMKDDSGDIKVTLFDEMADKYFPLIQEGNVYYFSNLEIKPRYDPYNNTSHKYELSLDSSMILETDENKDIQPQDDNIPIGENSTEQTDSDMLLDRLVEEIIMDYEEEKRPLVRQIIPPIIKLVKQKKNFLMLFSAARNKVFVNELDRDNLEKYIEVLLEFETKKSESK